jgi:hypothetical protein
MNVRSNIRGKQALVLSASAALGLSAGSLTMAAVSETHVYGVAEFGGSSECGSASQTHSVHEDTADEFADHFDDLNDDGEWDYVHRRNNTSCRGSYWTDSSKTSSCSCTADDDRDGYGTDDADVVFIHTHGGHTAGVRSSLLMGSSSYDCSVRTDDNMLFDSDLDFAVIKACQSGNYDVWTGGGYRQQFTSTDSPLRLWNAFHGDSSCGNHVKRYVRSYARDSDRNGVGENWIDEAYDNSSSANGDDCPCSITIGSSSSLRSTLFEYGGWRDRKDTGSKTNSSYFAISGCDPSNGSPLP